LIDWCLTPTLAGFQLYRGVNKFYPKSVVERRYANGLTLISQYYKFPTSTHMDIRDI